MKSRKQVAKGFGLYILSVVLFPITVLAFLFTIVTTPSKDTDNKYGAPEKQSEPQEPFNL